jgi:two-component system chemotaxis response regulator CheY
MNTPNAEADLSRMTFLIADDKAFFRDMAHTAVMNAGAKDVKHATSIEGAIEVLNRLGQQIGCVICDWDMPIGGLELLRMIRCKTLPKTPPRTPFIILTGKADSNAVQAAKAMDVNGFAVAPLSLEKLVKTLAAGINRAWNLQVASTYAAVPRVEPTAKPPEKTSGSGHSHGVILKAPAAAEGQGAAPRPTAGAPVIGKAFPRRPPELKNVHMCALEAVRPGDILARDILDRSGQLLLKTGTELRPSLIDRLNDVAQGKADSYHVWVGRWEEPG